MSISDKLPLKTILAREGLDGVINLLKVYCADMQQMNKNDPEIFAYWEDQREILNKSQTDLLCNTRSLP